MNIALLFSGQFRFVEEAYPSIKANLIDPNNIEDVFIHGWYDEDLLEKPYKYGGIGQWQHQRIKRDIHEIARDLYKPKLMKTDASKSFVNSRMDMTETIKNYYRGALNRPDLEPDFRNRTVNNQYSQFYSLLQAYLLCQEYSLANDKQYDCVVRCRTDTMLNTLINLKDYDMNKIHYQEKGQPERMISDWFNFASYEIMGAYCSIFTVHEILHQRQYKRNGRMGTELYIKEIINVFGIDQESHNWNITLPAF